MDEHEEIVSEIREKVMTRAVVTANLQVEIDIVKSFEYGYFPKKFATKTFHDLLEVEIKQYHPYYDFVDDKEKISDAWGYNSFDYSYVVDEIFEESMIDSFAKFVSACYTAGRYKKFFTEELEVTDDWEFDITNFCCELYIGDFFIAHENFPIYEQNPTIEELFEKYSTEIQAYRVARDDYERDKKIFYDNLKVELAQINPPNIQQKVTKNDVELLKFLRENYSKRELKLLIQHHKISVSNSLAAQYSAIQYPYPAPDLKNFIDKSFKQ